MRKLMFFNFIFLTTQLLIAQDTIIKYSGDKILGKIKEISPTQIIFKKLNAPDEVLYSLNKNDVAFIKYANGTTDRFEKSGEISKISNPTGNQNTNQTEKEDNKIYYVSWNYFGYLYKYHHKSVTFAEIHEILLDTNDPELKRMVRNAKIDRGFRFLGFAAIPLEIGAVVLLANSDGGTNKSRNTGAATCFVLGIACPIVGGILKHRYTTLTRSAIKIYNEKF